MHACGSSFIKQYTLPKFSTQYMFHAYRLLPISLRLSTYSTQTVALSSHRSCFPSNLQICVAPLRWSPDEALQGLLWICATNSRYTFHLYVAVERLKSNDITRLKRRNAFQAFHR